MSKLPKVSKEHRIEVDSKIILSNCLSPDAILREPTGTDYGIDGIIEFKNEKHEITGEEIAIQIKGTESIQSIKNGNFVVSPPIKTTTANYWLNKPQPVFLFCVDVVDSGIYFTDVKKYLIINKDKLEKQESITVRIPTKNTISKRDLRKLKTEYFFAANFEKSITELSRFIKNYRDYFSYLLLSSGKDCFMIIDNHKKDKRYMKYKEISDVIFNSSLFFKIPLKIKSVDFYINETYEQWNKEVVEYHFTEASVHLQGAIKIILMFIKKSSPFILKCLRNFDQEAYDVLDDEGTLYFMDMIESGQINLSNFRLLNDRY